MPAARITSGGIRLRRTPVGLPLLVVAWCIVAAGRAGAQSDSTTPPPVQPSPRSAESAGWLALSVDLEIFDQRDQTPNVRLLQRGTGAQPVTPLALDVATTAFGIGSDPAAPRITSFEASMAYLQAQSPALAPAERQMVMSLVGGRLNAGYSVTVTNNPDMNSVFQNARTGGSEGGVCGDIHTYLSLTAPKLGFQAAGTHTAYWWIDATSGGGHAVAHYRDHLTGEYYLQNYSNLYATGQKTLPNLLEISTRILGYAWASSVESLPGTMHLYVPRQARWVSELTADQAAASIHGPAVTLALGNREQTAGVQYGWATGHQQIKGYALGARFEADEGTYSFAHVGASYACHGSATVGWPWLQEAAFSSVLYGGALWLESPILRPDSGGSELRPVPWHQSTGLYGLSVSGSLRQGRTTETADVGFSTVNLPTQSNNELRLSIGRALASIPLDVYLRRVWNVADANGQPKNGSQIVTAYDQLGARWRLQPAQAVTLGIEADGFALGGIESGAGSAVQLGIDATWHTRTAGDFSVRDEWGKVVRNHAGDPFYDLPASHNLTLSWWRQLGRSSSISVQASYRDGPPIQPFGCFGPSLPGLDDGARQLVGRASFAIRY